MKTKSIPLKVAVKLFLLVILIAQQIFKNWDGIERFVITLFKELL
jgi:hypothetical protein